MKYCLSSRCSSKYLSQADEIKVAWRDRESIIDLANEYQSATIKKMIHEELTINAIPQQKSNYERFFGKDSKLYQQNFNEEMLNYGNNQSIQSNLSNHKFKI